jgi:hypothetical protein
VAAHRGGYGFPDSNTVTRFELTRMAGADVIETDLRLSKDGVVFLFHDSLLDRATECTGPIAERTAAEIERCHLKGLSRGPDRFEDALRWARGRVILDAELKTREVAQPAIDLVRRYAAFDWVYFQVGNDLEKYRMVRRYDQQVAVEVGPRGKRARQWLTDLLAERDPGLVIVQLHPDFLSPEILREIRAGGKLASLNAWLLEPEVAGASCSRVFALGVDVAVTNAPAGCVQQRDEARVSPGPRGERGVAVERPEHE